MIDVLWLCGTGHGTGTDGVSAAFGAALDGRFHFVPIRYPAAFGGFGMSYGDSVSIGRHVLIDAIRSTPRLAVIGGYSQGAWIAGELADEIGHGDHPDLHVAACALIADPGRPAGAGSPGLATAPGYGIAGERPVSGLPTYWAAAEGDPIASLPAGNPLRLVADLTMWLSLASPGDAHRWGVDLLDRAVAGRWQRWWSPRNVRTWGGAVAYARGYLLDDRHTLAYLTEGHAAALAAVLNREVS